MKFFILILILFFLSMLFVVSNNQISFSDQGSVEVFLDSYYDLVGKFFYNFKSVTGHVINMDWKS